MLYNNCAEDYFYTTYELIRRSKSAFIGDFFIKFWYLLAQRCPTMNLMEKLLCSPFGRPQYTLITKKEVPVDLHCDVYEMLVIKKKVLEAAVEDAKHDLQAYDYIQKHMHSTSTNPFMNFAQKFTDAAKKMICNEKTAFGRQLTKAMLALIMEICACKSPVISQPELRNLASRPSSLYFQENRKIREKILGLRNRQLSMITVLYAQKEGIGSISSTRNFHQQRYNFIKHPKTFFNIRPKLFEKITTLYGSLNVEDDYFAINSK